MLGTTMLNLNGRLDRGRFFLDSEGRSRWPGGAWPGRDSGGSVPAARAVRIRVLLLMRGGALVLQPQARHKCRGNLPTHAHHPYRIPLFGSLFPPCSLSFILYYHFLCLTHKLPSSLLLLRSLRHESLTHSLTLCRLLPWSLTVVSYSVSINNQGLGIAWQYNCFRPDN